MTTTGESLSQLSKPTKDAGTSAVWVQFDRFDAKAFPESLTSVKRGRILPSLLEVTARCCKSGFDKQRNPVDLREEIVVTTAVYGLADGWELTGSVEG